MKLYLLISVLMSGFLLQGCGNQNESSELARSHSSRGEGPVGKYINYNSANDAYYYAYRSDNIGSSVGIKAATDYVKNQQKTLEPGAKHVVTLNKDQMLTFGYMNNATSDRIWMELWLNDDSIMLDRKRSSGPNLATDNTEGGNNLYTSDETTMSTFGRVDDLRIKYLGNRKVEISRQRR